MDFLERLSVKIWNNKQDDGSYYSRYHCNTLTKEEVEEWLLKYIN